MNKFTTNQSDSTDDNQLFVCTNQVQRLCLKSITDDYFLTHLSLSKRKKNFALRSHITMHKHNRSQNNIQPHAHILWKWVHKSWLYQWLMSISSKNAWTREITHCKSIEWTAWAIAICWFDISTPWNLPLLRYHLDFVPLFFSLVLHTYDNFNTLAQQKEWGEQNRKF